MNFSPCRSMSKKRWKKVLKPTVFYGILAAVTYFSNRYISRALLDIRSTFKQISFKLVWTIYMVTNVFRITLILPYYIVPFGSFMTWYFMVVLGVETAALVLICSWVLQATMYIPAIRWLWTHRMALILDSKEQIWWFPDALKLGLLAIDGWWKDWATGAIVSRHANPHRFMRQGVLVYIMETSWFVGGLVPEVWLATRTIIPWWIYIPAITVSYWLFYPMTKVYGQAMLEVTSQEDQNLLGDFFLSSIKGFLLLNWWELIISLVLPILSTIFLHGHHLRIFCTWMQRRWYAECSDAEILQDEEECVELQPIEEQVQDEKKPEPDEVLDGH